MSEKGYSFPQSKSWYQRLSDDLASEVEAYTGEKRSTIEEMRRLLAVKGCYQLFDRMQAARQGKKREEALKSVARVMRAYALDRPALFAALVPSPSVIVNNDGARIDRPLADRDRSPIG